MSSFTQESTQKLAEAIAQDVFEYISEDGRYLDGIMNTIEPAIVSVIGQTSPELVGELGCAIMGMICIPSEKGVYQDDLWRARYERLYRYVKHTYAESYIDGAEYGIIVPDELYGY
jgi:hypothetical protein